jgi:hypothetical protein
MALHLVKLCVGIDDVEQLTKRRAQRRKTQKRCYVPTRHTPKRGDELVAGGSLFWVIRSQIRARQRILGIESEVDAEGRPHCLIELDWDVVPTEVVPWKPLPRGEERAARPLLRSCRRGRTAAGDGARAARARTHLKFFRRPLDTVRPRVYMLPPAVRSASSERERSTSSDDASPGVLLAREGVDGRQGRAYKPAPLPGLGGAVL